MKENSMRDYEVQRPQFFYRRSLSCKWLEMGASLEKVVLLVLFSCLDALGWSQEQPNGHAGFGADLPGCWHPVTTFVLFGALFGVFMILLIFFSTSLIFGNFA